MPGGWGPGLDYAFLSPVFDSISKEGYKSAGFEKDRLAAAIKKSGVSVIVRLSVALVHGGSQVTLDVLA